MEDKENTVADYFGENHSKAPCLMPPRANDEGWKVNHERTNVSLKDECHTETARRQRGYHAG